MAHSDYSNQTTQKSLLATMLLSLILHGVGVAYLRPFAFDADEVTPPLVVELQQPEPPPPPPPEPEPEPPKPEPPKPQPKPLPPPPVKTPLPPPVEHATIPDTPPPPPPPQVIAAAPEKVAEPTFVAPPSEPERPQPAPPVVDIDADLSKYGSLLAREFAKHKQYPRIAQMRGWQGKPVLEIHIDANGKVTEITVKNASEYESLDKAAIDTVRKTILPMIPDSLRGKEFTVTVPFDFKLQ